MLSSPDNLYDIAAFSVKNDQSVHSIQTLGSHLESPESYIQMWVEFGVLQQQAHRELQHQALG